MVKAAQLTPRQIIEQSGHAHHSRVVVALRKLGWIVAVSPYYSDNFTDKPREIDIIAEKDFPCEDRMSGFFGHLVVRLFIECKYVPSTTVFWFDAKDMVQAEELVRREMHWRAEIPWAAAEPYKLHQLQDGPVAKLFSTGQRSDENEAFARAINQTLNGLIYYRGREVARRQPNARLLGRLTFPIIALNSFRNLHRTDMRMESAPVPITDPFQLEVSYAYRRGETDLSEYFLVDVVSLDSIEAFVRSLEQNEVQARIQNILRERRDQPRPTRRGSDGW